MTIILEVQSILGSSEKRAIKQFLPRKSKETCIIIHYNYSLILFIRQPFLLLFVSWNINEYCKFYSEACLYIGKRTPEVNITRSIWFTIPTRKHFKQAFKLRVVQQHKIWKELIGL